MRDDPFFERYHDTIHNIEFAIMWFHTHHPDTISDETVHRVYDAIVRTYQHRLGQQPEPILHLDDLEQQMFDALRGICAWWTGESHTIPQHRTLEQPSQIIEETVMLDCVLRLRSSVRLWTGQYGEKGYLKFISNDLT